MSKLESIVPPLELCKLIPAGEFEDSVLVWRDHSCLGYYVSERFAGETSDCRGEQKFDYAGNVDLVIMKATLPAPTLAEILAKLPEGVQMRMRTARNRERHFQIYHYSYETWTNYQPPPRSGCGCGSGGRTGDEQESRCLDKAAALRKRRGRDQGNQVGTKKRRKRNAEH